MDKLKDSIRAKTKRTNGCSLPRIAGALSLTLQGWFGYFQHCHWNVFIAVDSWVRGRLRSILRKRKGGRGRGRGTDHQRWPNTYFAEHGLFSLQAAHVRLYQSLTGP
jgi:RNA-directed DNA polymerase